MLPPKTSSIEIIHIATKLECNLGSLIRKVANAPQLTRSGDLETDGKHDGGLILGHILQKYLNENCRELFGALHFTIDQIKKTNKGIFLNERAQEIDVSQRRKGQDEKYLEICNLH